MVSQMSASFVLSAVGTLLLMTLMTVSAQPNTNVILYGCTFEEPTNNNTVIPYPDQFTWTTWTGKTPSQIAAPSQDPPTTGPFWDHTFGPEITTGHYSYTEATGFYPGDVAVLELPALTAPASTGGFMCLTFWWSMCGKHIGTMNVTQTTSSGVSTLWSLEGPQECLTWNQTNVTLTGTSGSSLVVSFIGVRGGADIGQPYGDMAI